MVVDQIKLQVKKGKYKFQPYPLVSTWVTSRAIDTN